MTDRDDVERLRLSILATEIEPIQQVLTCIDDVDPAVRLESMSIESPGQSSVEIDTDEITPKQWEALVLAFERGYYDRPRTVELEALADELSISKSAVSQRLRGAEATLIESIVRESQPAMVDQ
ncbi:helix-turn-helix domain-containing protein [Halosolutus amylolyticus]|uniref:Helix-turn-helix domain-containing protein n=1 Tax=Halosolutus amylolyticus TaxID=2932267 RepID=A0ABD5PNN8_9EURY|nr:helix-turn-helix domain-containing protein [Halosolutus amylolyticus]